MAEEKKSSGFVLTKDGKAAIFKQNDGFKLKIKSFALFKDKTNKLRKLIEDSGFDYSVLEDLEYDYFNKENEFLLKSYNDNFLKTNQRKENGQKILSLEVDIFNDNKTNSNTDNDETIYDGIIYFCDSYENYKITNLSETQENNTIYAIQYFYKNKINLKANQDSRISFSIQIRFTQNNYEVIDLDMPLDTDNGLRLYNDATSNAGLRSKTIGTTKSLAIGNNQNEIGSIVDIYADDGKNQIRLLNVNRTSNDGGISKEVDILFADNTFSISGTVNNASIFSKDNDFPNAGEAFYGFSNKNSLTNTTGTYLFQNSNNNKINKGTGISTYLNSNGNESDDSNNVFINSKNIKNELKDTFINSENLYLEKSNHNTFLNTSNGTFNNVSNFVSLGGYNYTFNNVSNCIALGHDLTVNSTDKNNTVGDTVIFGCYNSEIKSDDIFVLANGTESKPNNALKVNKEGEIIINDGNNRATISPTGINVGGQEIKYVTIYNIIHAQDTYNNWQKEGDELKKEIQKVAADSITNMSLIIDSDYYKVDEHVDPKQKINNFVVSIYNPFENEVTVEYIYHQKTAMTNPEENIIQITETVTVNKNALIQLMFVETEDYRGFVIIE